MKLSVSTERFERKEDIIPKQLYFEQDLLTVEEFKEKVKDGYCFCHWFYTSKDVFSIAEKTKVILTVLMLFSSMSMITTWR